MRVTSRTLQIAAVSAALACAAASPAFAAPQVEQTAPAGIEQRRPAPAASQGPLVLTPIESVFVISPQAKVTRIGGVTSGLAGVFAGKVIEDKLTVGGSAFWLVSPEHSTQMWYVGAVAGWKLAGSGRWSVRAQALLGAGQATQVVTFVFPFSPTFPGSSGNFRARVRDSFVIAEPELTLQMKIVNRVRLTLGAGYRGTSRAFGVVNDLRGPTATVGLEFRIGR